MFPSRRSSLLGEIEAAMPATLITTKPADFIPHTPEPKQRRFLDLMCLEALYGGAAGGGKTDALLMDAAQFVHVPGYSAILFRRKYTDLALPGAIMDRAKEWWGPRSDIQWSAIDKRFTFPSGATVSFGYMDSEQDRFRYQSAEFQFVGFDELTQFPERWYTYLLSRLRRLAGVSIPLRARSASNPGGIGHDWVLERFVEGGIGRAERAFVPASLDDNPHLDTVSYREALANLDTTTRRQLEEGVWIRDSGGRVYGSFLAERNVIDALPPAKEAAPWQYILGLDFGIVDPNALSVVAWRAFDPVVYVVMAYAFPTEDVTEMVDEVENISKQFQFDRIVGDEGGMGKGFAAEMRRRRRIPVMPAEKTNKIGYIKILNSDMAHGRVQLVRGRTDELIDEWRGLMWAESGKREADGQPNHVADATLYAWRTSSAFTAVPEPKKPESPGDAEYDRLLAQKAADAARGSRMLVDDFPRWSRRG